MPIEIFSRVKDGSLDKISTNSNTCNIDFTYKKKDFKFNVNKLWNNNERNVEIFNHINEKSREYKRVFWIAFGYTGSGKTYTIYGMLNRLLQHLNTYHNDDIYITAYQIYNDDIYDMINKNKKVKIWKTDDLILKDLKKVKLKNISKFFDALKKNRALASTNMNATSSRSHAIIDIYIGNNQFTLVDMAGQESGVTGHENERLIRTQGSSINLNMLALKECIRTHYQNETYVPFRRSLLTLALKPIFVRKCYTAFICTVSTNHNLFYQIDSLRYASALYNDKDNETTKKYFDIFNTYTEFLKNMKNITIDEKKLWNDMQQGNFKNCNDINKYLLRRCDLMIELGRNYKNFNDEIEGLSENNT